MGELPTDLSAMMEAVSAMMGEEFAEILEEGIAVRQEASYWRGRDEERAVWTFTLARL